VKAKSDRFWTMQSAEVVLCAEIVGEEMHWTIVFDPG